MKVAFNTYLIKIINWICPNIKLSSLFKSMLHSIWMIVFSLLWLEHVNTFDGFEFMSNINDYKEWLGSKITRHETNELSNEKYLFINTSKNNFLLPVDNDNLLNTVITDRVVLAKVLNILDSNALKIKYIICDIFFYDYDLNNDSILQSVINRLDKKGKIIIPYYISNNRVVDPIISSNMGLSQYDYSFLKEQYLKFNYITQDTLKKLPLLVYEKIANKTMEVHNKFGLKYYTLDKTWCLNTIIPEFRIKSENLISDLTYYDMGIFSSELITMDQIVFIGDFEGIYDNHITITNRVPGPLILINALESLFNGDNIVRFSYLIYLFLFFLIISYNALFKPKENSNLLPRKEVIYTWLTKNITYILIFILTISSMYLFHHYINLMILLTYFIVIDFVKSLVLNLK